MSSCPPSELLIRLGSGALGAATYCSLEDHVESCEPCQAFLQRLVDLGPRVAHGAAARLPAPESIPVIPDLTVERELGRGSMGVVYLARQESLQRLVALKILCLGPDTDSRERERWRREARAASRAPHPNAVQVFQVGESAGWLYLVFEYVPGGTLKDRLKEPLPPAVAARLLNDLARAVGHFHRSGVLHLDLKPSNILLDGETDSGWERVTPKVADFGISRLRNEPGATTGSRDGPLGTPDYMAPEQAAARRALLGPACDIYALGAILYHTLSGRPPFQAASVVETLDQVRGQEPVPPRRLNPSIPRDLDTVCLKCLQKDPRRRYESAEALADDLRRWREGRSITARPASALEHAWRWCRRRPAIAALASILMLTLAAGFAGLLLLLEHSETERIKAVTARRLAEENGNTSVAMIIQFTRLASAAFSDPSQPLLDDRTDETAQILRDRIGELKNHPGFDRKILGHLGTLERMRAQRLNARGQREAARGLLSESLALLEAGRQADPGDQWLIQQHISSLVHLGGVVFAENQVDRALDCLDKAAALIPAIQAQPDRIRYLVAVSNARRSYTDQLAARGDRQRFERALEADCRMFDSVSALDRSDRSVVICMALTLAGLSGQRAPHLELADEFSSPGSDDAGPETWADQRLADVQAACKIIGIDRSVTPEVVWGAAPSVFEITSAQRRSSKLADARRTGERYRAVADRLVAHFPERPVAYLVLSEAFVQQSKTAWRDNDVTAVNRLERQALDAARHALALDSGNDDARRLVADREFRVARLSGK